MHQHARFYRDGARDYVEISYVGSKDTFVQKVTPELMARFRDEWNAHCDGVPLKQRVGTPLTDIPNMKEELAAKYIAANVHTAEEFAALSDAQCQGLGHGTLTLRTACRGLLEQRRAAAVEAATKKISEVAASVTAMPQAEADARYASKSDVDELKAMLAQLINAQKSKRGRPPKVKDPEE